MAEHRDASAPELARHIYHAAERFERGNHDPGDDKTVVVIPGAETVTRSAAPLAAVPRWRLAASAADNTARSSCEPSRPAPEPASLQHPHGRA